MGTCPNPTCGKPYHVDGSAAGRKLRCKHCSHVFPAPSSVTAGPVPPGRSAPATLAPGQRLGRYEIRDTLGAGAFGQVYRAFDPVLRREVALKVLKPELTSDEVGVARFLREATAAAGLQHPHIVPVYDAGQDDGRYFIASALITGKPLADAVPATGADFGTAARVVRQLAEALAYAHEQGVVHRDVKPANALLDAGGNLLLTDFGLASHRDADTKLTHDGAVMGTPAYMSPEQASGQPGGAEPATDQYAAGVVLYELLTGSLPFVGPPAVVMYGTIHTPPTPPSGLRPGVPPDLEAVCLKALSKQPADRYPSCAALADDLRRWLAGVRVQAERAPSPTVTVVTDTGGPVDVAWGGVADSPVKRVSMPARRRKGKRTWVATALGQLAVGTVLTAGVVLVAILVAKPRTAERPTEATKQEEAKRPNPKTKFQQVFEPDPGTVRPEPFVRPPTILPGWAIEWKTLRAGSKPGDTVSLAVGGYSVRMTFCWVPPGEFDRGSDAPDAEAQHRPVRRVRITKGLWVAKYETMRAQWSALGFANPNSFKGDMFPVYDVSHDDAVKYAERLGALTGTGARLPTEAEWEYACR
ncbi:MAG TPA: protein kinase, partial [Urbifossiella sp.]|nr:protein kinase [Urbifossiella sp.]